MSNIKDQNDFNERAQAASYIATLQASYTDFHYLRDIWRKNTEKDALLGVSMTGIASENNLKFTNLNNFINLKVFFLLILEFLRIKKFQIV